MAGLCGAGALLAEWRACRLQQVEERAPVVAVSPPPGARLDRGFSGHVLRRRFSASFRKGYDLVVVAELMGHARTETAPGLQRAYRRRRPGAINSLLADR